jgi:hypothetical protein
MGSSFTFLLAAHTERASRLQAKQSGIFAAAFASADCFKIDSKRGQLLALIA